MLLLVILVLNLCVSATGCFSQGPQEQRRGTESQQMPGEEETTEETMETPQKMMEETANEEQKDAP